MDCSVCGWHSETTNYPSRCDNGDREHDRRFHQLSYSRAQTRDYPQYANGAKNEARSEYEGEIEYTRFQNLHSGLLSPNMPISEIP